jgi:hypothetical protein
MVMTSESEMRAAATFAAEVFAPEGLLVDGLERVRFGAAAFDVDVFAVADFATLEDFELVRAADFFTGLLEGFFVGM